MEDKDLTGTTPAGGQQHGDSAREGGTVDSDLHHPRPDTPGSRVEDQADQPGVTSGRDDRA